MQQRRGTAAQWTSADPILAAGEIGFESDTGQFKIGDGVNHWEDLSYFKNLEDLGGSLDDYVPVDTKGQANGVAQLDSTGNVPLSQLGNLIAGAPAALDTLNELAAAINDDATFATGVLSALGQKASLDQFSAHSTSTSNVHGISNTEDLATKAYADGSVTSHNSLTTNIHGIANTALLATSSDVSTAVSTHTSVTTNIHGISDTSVLATATTVATAKSEAITEAGTAADTKISTAVAALTSSSVGLANVDNTSDADKPVSTATQTALDLKAPIAAPSFTGDANFESNVTIEGNLTVEGTTTTVNTSEVQIDDPLFYLAANQYDTDTRDIGITGAYGTVGGTEQDHLHTGLVKDVTDGKWKLFSNVPHPVNNVVDFTSAAYDTLKVGLLEATTVTPSSGVVFSDGTQTKEGVVSRTPIIAKTDSYTLSALTERDSLIEVAKSSATTITIPLNSAVAYPVGTSLDILQTGTGQVTIAGAAGVTVNATPGLKLRTQWSSATLFKRAENTWVVYGDLMA